MARVNRKECPLCGKIRYQADYIATHAHCSVCEDEYRRRNEGYRKFNFGPRIGKLIASDKDAKAMAQWCAATLDMIGGPEALPRILSEYISDTSVDHTVIARGEMSRRIRETELAWVMVKTLTCLEELASREQRIKEVTSKPVKEMSKQELLDAISEVAIPIIEDNPQVAVKCLESAGYKVTLEKK